MILHDFYNPGLIHCPKFLLNNTHYLSVMGSRAYACNLPDSDYDVYGFAIPNKEDLFPHLRGEIFGFGKQKNRFEQWEELHLTHPTTSKEWGFTVYSIVKYFDLAMKGNPSLIDSLFTAENCVIHTTQIGQLVRDNRKLFLSKACYHRYMGYARSQMHKIQTKTPQKGSKRYADVQSKGFDSKFAYHVCRTMLEAEQILQTGDLDLQRDNELYKAVRRGEWPQERVEEFFASKEKYLETLYENSNLQYSPDEEKIKKLLLECLEIHYGSLDKAIVMPDKYEQALRDIATICQKAGIQ